MERVGIYNRCSTEEESQMNALATQAFESREIAEQKGWQVAEQYIESQTGTVSYKRSEYQRLLGDMEKDRFDIVMIKSIDRLMRSAKDWYFFLNRLTENKLRLYIYIEGKFYTPEDNLISGIKAILAEDFSRELSKKIKNAHRRRQQKKSGYNITCDMFGWNKVGKDLYEINEEEAEYYRTAFALAREGKGFYTISNRLYELGARGKKGRKISEVQWRKMLYAPRAHGTMILHTRDYNFDTKKYEEVPEKDWIILDNALPQIVSREYQEEVIKIMRARADAYKVGRGQSVSANHGKYELTGKLKCAECGRCYYRTCYASKKGKKTVWKCATFLENGRTNKAGHSMGCDNINLSEEKMIQCMAEILQRQYGQLWEKDRLLTDAMNMIRKTFQLQNGEKEWKLLEKEAKKLTARKDMLMEKLLGGVISDSDFQRYHGQAEDRLKLLETKMDGIKKNDLQYNNYEARLHAIEEAIREENLIEKAIIKEFFRWIDHIEVHRNGRLKIYFDKEGTCVEEAMYETGY